MIQDYVRQRDGMDDSWISALRAEVIRDVRGEILELRAQVETLTAALAAKNVMVAAPNVNVEAPSVSIEPAAVNITADMDMTALSARFSMLESQMAALIALLSQPVTRTVQRDDNNGKITSLTETRG